MGTILAYISLGVVEHDFCGPEEFLREAHRVLAPEGVVILSVPYYNLFRRFNYGPYRFSGRVGNGLPFYQYAYGRREIERFLTQAGFDVLDVERANAVKGLQDELPLLKDVLSYASYATSLRSWIKESRRLNDLFGHKLMLACRKRSDQG